MTCQEFETMNFESQVDIIREEACIGSREGTNFSVMLYQLGNFYVEAYQHKKYRYIYQVKCFTDIHCLEEYLLDIVIPKDLFFLPKSHQ